MQIIVVPTYQQGIERAKDLLYEKVDKKTILFLSGGATPKGLYSSLAADQVIMPAGVGMIDERFGKKMHDASNEVMLESSGLLAYLQKIHVPFYPLLPSNAKTLGRQKVASLYDAKARDLFFHFPRSVAVMGIGSDGHTASIIPNRKDLPGRQAGFINPMFEESEHHIFVGDFNDTNSEYKERIGMTFAGLSLIDYFIILAFGKEKKKALQKMFTPGDVRDLPARFFNQEVSDKTVIITDQTIL